jgi:DNA transformation protein
MAVDQGFLDFVLDQLSGLRRVSSRRMFGGIGLYSADEFFALIDDGRLYLYTDATTRPRYEAEGMRAFEYAPGQFLRSYYEIPVDVLEDDGSLCEWAREAVEAHRRKPRPRTRKKARAAR